MSQSYMNHGRAASHAAFFLACKSGALLSVWVQDFGVLIWPDGSCLGFRPPGQSSAAS